MLEASLAAKAESAKHSLRDRLAEQRCGNRSKQQGLWCSSIRLGERVWY